MSEKILKCIYLAVYRKHEIEINYVSLSNQIFF